MYRCIVDDSGRTLLEVSLADIEPNEFGEQTTEAMMKEKIRNFGTVKDWVIKCGTKAKHSQEHVNAIEAMLVEGTQNFEFHPPLELLQHMVPNSCPGVWYIYLNTENERDMRLYRKLADVAEGLQQVTNKTDQLLQWANNLRDIETKMAEELEAWVGDRMQDSDANNRNA